MLLFQDVPCSRLTISYVDGHLYAMSDRPVDLAVRLNRDKKSVRIEAASRQGGCSGRSSGLQRPTELCVPHRHAHGRRGATIRQSGRAIDAGTHPGLGEAAGVASGRLDVLGSHLRPAGRTRRDGTRAAPFKADGAIGHPMRCAQSRSRALRRRRRRWVFHPWLATLSVHALYRPATRHRRTDERHRQCRNSHAPLMTKLYGN